MVEAKYYKDFRHNYLIIKNENSPADVYQCKMITGNRIDGLIPCQERHINGEMLLYYEITSKQSLASLYETSCITMQQLNKLFMQLKRVWEGISKFLLDESSLMLKPEFIFADAETEELTFLYYPFEAEENYVVLLLEFLADKVNSEDREAVEIIYKMLELATREQFVLDEVLAWFEEDCGGWQKENGECKEYEEIYEASIPQAGENENANNEEICQSVQRKSKITEKAACIGIFLSVVLFGIFYYIYVNWKLSEKEMIFLFSGFILLGICFLASGFWLLYKRTFNKRQPIREKISDLWEREEEEKLYQNTTVCEKIQEKEKAAYGNTIFIPWIENCENKLYGIGKGNKNHIELNRLPLTVGKLAGSVDMVINDQSISRRHVKFAREGNRIYMTDLNSTNGTFKNGLRLQPNTTEILEPGDEIRLGKLKFIYR